MRAVAWAHRRVSIPLEDCHAVPIAEVAGDGRTRLRIRVEGAENAAPILGALSYPATWHAGRWTGEARISVIPQWSWGYEVHFAVSRPPSLAGHMLWTRRRLERLADGLAEAHRLAAEAGAVRLHARPAASRAGRRWSPAASGSAR